MTLGHGEKAKAKQAQHERRLSQAPEPANNGGHFDAMMADPDEYNAAAADLDLTAWGALSGAEKIHLEEKHRDSRFAREQGMTLERYRASVRRRYERGEFREGFGQPQWLRDEYAAERPHEFVIEALDLIAEGMVSTGPRLVEVFRKINARTRTGLVYEREPLPPFEMAKTHLMEEIERVGLMEFFLEARRLREGN